MFKEIFTVNPTLQRKASLKKCVSGRSKEENYVSRGPFEFSFDFVRASGFRGTSILKRNISILDVQFYWWGKFNKH